MKLHTEFFNNKRLLVILSGITCILIALVIFVISIIGFGNIGAFLGGKPVITEEPAGNQTPDSAASATPTGLPTQAPDSIYTPSYSTTPPAEETPSETIPETEEPTATITQEPTPTPTPADVPVSDITIREGNFTVTEKESMQLHAIITPENAEDKTVEWTSSDKNVATVDADGFLVARSAGKAYITARAGDQFTQIMVTVRAATVAVDKVLFEKESISLNVGESTDLKDNYMVSPSNATDKKATWSSDSKAVTVVNGQIKAESVGIAKITVTVGGKSATITVVVEEKEQKPTVEPTAEPTEKPTEKPTAEPTAEPTEKPTAEPTEKSTAEPTVDSTVDSTVEPSPTNATP